METGMSEQELERVEVIALRQAGQIDQSEAARRLKVSVRQVRRLEARVVLGGPAALRSARRGQPSNRRVAPAVASQAVALIRQHYADFAPTLAAEYLGEHHGISLSKETVRRLMIEARLWRARRGPSARLHAQRERRERFGELIQIDGSYHAWFEARAQPCCLLVFIDDATSRLTQCRFLPHETTFGYMQTLYEHIGQHGLPMALYSDRHSIFSVNSPKAKARSLSQFARALQTLGIEGICANSPQAKGRVERANRTLQDRLVKAMRLARIDSIEQANAWLPGFVSRHNAKFSVSPQFCEDAHVAYRDKPAKLRQILAKHHPRKLSPQLSCQFDSTLLQAHFNSGGLGMRGAAVTVIEHFDCTLELLWRGKPLEFALAPVRHPGPPVIGRKQVLHSLASVALANAQRLPAKTHPWRNSPFGAPSPEFTFR
jgi:transposase